MLYALFAVPQTYFSHSCGCPKIRGGTMKKLLIATAALAAFGIASAQTTIKIASATPLSGAQAGLGTQIRNGAQLAIEDAQARFKAMGFDLVLEATDDQANPDTGVSNANQMINDDAILGVVGHLNSGVAIPSSEVYNRVGLVMVSPANTNVNVTDRKLAVVNRVCGRDDIQGSAAAEFAVKNLKATKLMVINDKTAYGQGLAQFFVKRAVSLKAKIVANVGTEERANFASLVTQIRKVKPQAIFFSGTYDSVGPFARQLRAAGIKTPIVGADGIDSSDYLKLAGKAGALNTYYTSVAGPIAAFPKAKAVATAYKAKFGNEIVGFGILAYDSAQAVINGIETAIKANGGNLPSRAEVAAAVRKGKFAGLTGNIAFDSKGDIAQADYFIMGMGTKTASYPGTMISKIVVPAPKAK